MRTTNGIKSSRYRGVSWHKVHRKWLVMIRDRNSPTVRRTRFVGLFATELEAAQAYNAAAIEIHGDAAVLNALPEDPPPPTRDEIDAECAAIRAGWSDTDYAERAPHWAPMPHALPTIATGDLVIYQTETA